MKALLVTLILTVANISIACEGVQDLHNATGLQNAMLKILRASEVAVDTRFSTLCTDGQCSITLDEVVCEEYPLGARTFCSGKYLQTNGEGDYEVKQVSTKNLKFGPLKSLVLANDIIKVLKNNGVDSTPVGQFGAGNRYDLEFLDCFFNTEKRSDGHVYPANVTCSFMH